MTALHRWCHVWRDVDTVQDRRLSASCGADQTSGEDKRHSHWLSERSSVIVGCNFELGNLSAWTQQPVGKVYKACNRKEKGGMGTLYRQRSWSDFDKTENRKKTKQVSSFGKSYSRVWVTVWVCVLGLRITESSLIWSTTKQRQSQCRSSYPDFIHAHPPFISVVLLPHLSVSPHLPVLHLLPLPVCLPSDLHTGDVGG